jgi:uncharacterized repeat protein (TIGR03803 family)
MHQWLTLASRAARRPAPHRTAVRRQPSRPRLELLEDRLTPATLTTLASGLSTPQGGMVEDSHGNLFGTTALGGAYDLGTVFEVAAGSGTVTTLASFTGADGSSPVGDLVMDSQGNLYGTTYTGGTSPLGQGGGTVFELPNGSNTITDLVTFYQSDDGVNALGVGPYSGLYEDSQGNLFGTTTYGGVLEQITYGEPVEEVLGSGTLFEIASGTHTFTTRAVFYGPFPPFGVEPKAPPIEDSSGNLFGLTTMGGVANAGTVYEVAVNGPVDQFGHSLPTDLASFYGSNGANGPSAHIPGRLVMDSQGNLFGTTYEGGATWNGGQDSGYGTVFEIANGSNTITTLVSFDGRNDPAHGYSPAGGLVMDGHGNLFGTTAGGGAYGYGTVFEIANGSNTITTLVSFDGDGASPVGDLVMDKNGDLYGVTSSTVNSNTVFEVTTGISPFGDVTLQAPDVTSSNAALQNPYIFSLNFHDETLVNYQSVLGATVQVQPPSGPALTAHLAGIVEAGPNGTDASGDAALLSATYEITSPGSSWADAPAGTYSVIMSGSPVTDLAGHAAPLGTEGTFTVAVTPTVTAVSSTAANGTYGTGTTIPITVSWSKAVNVTGTPLLALSDGATASYAGGSGTNTLTFTYTVAAGQTTGGNNLDVTSVAALSLNGGTIKDSSGDPANLTLPAPGAASSLGANNSIVIDAVAPTVQHFYVLFGSQQYDLVGSTRFDLPWRITGIRVVYSKAIGAADVSSLAGLMITGLSGLDSNTLTWTINAITDGTFATSLLGTGADAIKDALGNSLVTYDLNFRVLWGDFNDDGVVNAADLRSIFNATGGPYNLFADLNGDGVVDMSDVTIVRNRIGHHL